MSDDLEAALAKFGGVVEPRRQAQQPTNTEKLQAIHREIAYRKRVFTRLVALGKMTQYRADYQIAVFEAIAKDYEPLAAKERLL